MKVRDVMITLRNALVIGCVNIIEFALKQSSLFCKGISYIALASSAMVFSWDMGKDTFSRILPFLHFFKEKFLASRRKSGNCLSGI